MALQANLGTQIGRRDVPRLRVLPLAVVSDYVDGFTVGE